MAPAVAVIKQAANSGASHQLRLALNLAETLTPFLEEGAEDKLASGEWLFSRGTSHEILNGSTPKGCRSKEHHEEGCTHGFFDVIDQKHEEKMEMINC